MQLVVPGPAGPPVEPVTQQSTETQAFCLQCCIVTLIKFMFSTSGKLIVSSPYCSFSNVRVGPLSSFVFVFFWLKSFSRFLNPKSTDTCAITFTVALSLRAKEERLTQGRDLPTTNRKRWSWNYHSFFTSRSKSFLWPYALSVWALGWVVFWTFLICIQLWLAP